jgi:hypothetical protein
MTVDANGTDVGQVIKLGIDKNKYKVTFRVTTSTPYLYEAEWIINVGDD